MLNDIHRVFYRPDKPYHIVLLWGITTAVGAGLTQAELLLTPDLPGTVVLRVMVYWTILMAIPVAGSLSEYRHHGDRTHLNVRWSIGVVAGMLLTWGAFIADIPVQQALYSFFHLWMLIPTAMFAVSAWRLHGTSRRIYTAATLGTAGLAAALLLRPTALQWVYAGAVIVQGCPMLLDWYLQR